MLLAGDCFINLIEDELCGADNGICLERRFVLLPTDCTSGMDLEYNIGEAVLLFGLSDELTLKVC